MTHKYKVIAEWPGMPPWFKLGEIVDFNVPDPYLDTITPPHLHSALAHIFYWEFDGIFGKQTLMVHEIDYYKFTNNLELIFD